MRYSVHDYAVKFERATDLENKLKTEGFKSLPSSRHRDAHWSSDMTDCMRKRYISFHDVPETNPTSFKGYSIFAFGSLVDDLTAKLMMRARVFVEEEYSFRLNIKTLRYPISGRIDIVIEEPNGQLVPVEVKTIKSDSFYDRDLKWSTGSRTIPGVINEPKLAHVAQLMTYIYHMGTEFGYLIYWNKDNQDLHIHKIYWSQELFEDAVKDAATLENYLELDTLPPRPVTFNVTFYKKDTQYNKKGDIKVNELGFPCAYEDKATGEEVFCKYFLECWSKEILESTEAGDGVKAKILLHQEAKKAKAEGVPTSLLS